MSLKKLKELTIGYGLFSLPKELGELTRLTILNLCCNEELGKAPSGEDANDAYHDSYEDLRGAPRDVAFPAGLGRMRSLREHNLAHCYLRTIPAFIGKLESLEVLDPSWNSIEIDAATLDSLFQGCPRLREVDFFAGVLRTPESRAHIEAFAVKLRARNPNAMVRYE